MEALLVIQTIAVAVWFIFKGLNIRDDVLS